MKFNAKVSISRLNSGDVLIEIKDADAVVRVMTMTMSTEAFGNAVTGLSGQLAAGVASSLDKVGKVREIKVIEFAMPEESWRDKEEAVGRARLATPEGWIPPSVFNSQRSFFGKDGRRWARGAMTRWVDKPEEEG